jgi:hypothetical protein
MFSTLRPHLIYEDISSDIVEHDIDCDAEEWSYNGKNVYRGLIDQKYIDEKLHVYWLYDDNSKKVGLAEHESDSPEIFKALWIYENNPFATLYQNLEWKETGSTLWSKLSNEAYQDCLEQDFKNVFDDALKNNTLILTPSNLKKDFFIYECEKCNHKSFLAMNGHSPVKKIPLVDLNHYFLLFLDDSFLVFDPPLDFTPFVSRQRHDDDVQEQQLRQAPESVPPE